MKVVADTNVLFSALISGKNIYLEIFEAADVYVPDFVFIEMARYESRIRQRANMQESLKGFTQELFSYISVIPNLAIESGSFMEAHRLCRDIDPEDIPFVALNIDLKVPLWTNDKKLSDGLKAEGFTNLMNSLKIFDLLPQLTLWINRCPVSVSIH